MILRQWIVKVNVEAIPRKLRSDISFESSYSIRCNITIAVIVTAASNQSANITTLAKYMKFSDWL